MSFPKKPEALKIYFKKWLISLCLFTVIQMTAMGTIAQARKVEGTVRDSKAAPLQKVSVMVQGSSGGVTTDAKGNYTIKVEENAVLIFSITGYFSKTENVEGRTVID